LLEFIVLEVDYFFEGERLLRVAVASESVENFREFGLTNNGVLDLAYVLVSKDDAGFVDSKFEWQEEDWKSYLVSFANFD